MKEYTIVRFPSKILKTELKVFVMLPKSYAKTQKHYPVLYMHDGQNLFDEALSYKGEIWGVYEMYEECPELPEVIIVGIETAGEYRSDLLVPYTFNFKDLGFDQYGTKDYGGLTDDYLQYIIHELKPYIDQKYRTFKSPKNTAIMGSSFGGVCSTYAAIKYNKHFSRFGCLSNAYWVIQKEMEEAAQEASIHTIKKLYLDTGTKESSRAIEAEQYIDSNQKIYDILKTKIDPERIRFDIIADAVHSENAWRERLPNIISFLFND